MKTIWFVLLMGLVGCADQPRSIADGAETVAPYGYIDYCIRHPDDNQLCRKGK